MKITVDRDGLRRDVRRLGAGLEAVEATVQPGGLG